MEKSGQQGQDQASSASISTLPLHGDGSLPDNQINKPQSPQNKRIIFPSPSVDASRSQTPVNSSNSYTAPEQTYFYGGYENGTINWGENSNYVHTNNLQIVSPAIYNDNPSVLFHPAYGFDPYGQFSPITSPLSPILIDGQLYTPSYYPQPISPTDFATSASSSQEGVGENMFLDQGLGYYLNYPVSNGFGFYNGLGEPVSNQSTPGGILGPYEHNFAQIPQQQTPYHGYGFLPGSSTKPYPQTGSWVNQRDPLNLASDSHPTASDRNRGPRASKPKENNLADHKSDLYNRPDFATIYEKAKFFVIKSFSEDNVHRSIKHGVWASTPLGNRKLDATFQEAKESGDMCPIFLFFSVNASGQFCGVAEMIGPVDFEKDADYWHQDRWSGQFRVKWHIIKDVPNSRLRHILLQNNDNKPVTHSRDSQEVNFEEGIAMLKIFKEHESNTSILDDFSFYDEREKSFQEKRAKERVIPTKNVDDDSSINQLSDRVAGSLHLEKDKEVQ